MFTHVRQFHILSKYHYNQYGTLAERYGKGRTAYCKKCFQKTFHEIKAGEPQYHYNCGGELIAIDYSDIWSECGVEIGERITVIDRDGVKKRLTIGITTGWKPVLIGLHNARSTSSCILLEKNKYLGREYLKKAIGNSIVAYKFYILF